MAAEWVFEESDRDGIPVRLTADRWHMHITVKHGEVEPFLQEIQEVIRDPGIVTENDEGVRHCATLGAVRGRWVNLYLEVVVGYDRSTAPGMGNVLTVHFNSRPPKGMLKSIRTN